MPRSHLGESFMFYVKYRNGRLTYARLKTRYSTLLGHVCVLDVTSAVLYMCLVVTRCVRSCSPMLL